MPPVCLLYEQKTKSLLVSKENDIHLLSFTSLQLHSPQPTAQLVLICAAESVAKVGNLTFMDCNRGLII